MGLALMSKVDLSRIHRRDVAFPKGDRWLGVKLGQTAVKTAVLRRDRGRIVLEDFGFMEVVPPGAEGRSGAVAEALHELTARVDRKGLRTCLVIDGAHVDVNFVQVPGRIPEKEFKQAALLQAASLVSFDPETTAWDAVRQGAGAGDVSPTLVAVSTLADVTELERVMSAAGLSLDLITVAPLTLGTLVPEGAGGNVAVMDIGARSTAVAVFQGERLLYARDTRVGSDPITDEIAEMFDGDRALAESLKRNWVLPAPGEELQPILLGGEPYVLDPSRIESMHQMREELLRTLRYIQDRVGLPISRLVLTGGGSRLGGLVGYLNLPASIQTGVADPLAVLDDVAAGVNSPLLQSVSHRLSQAVGAAYLGIRALPSRQLNLLTKQSIRKAPQAMRPAPTGWVKVSVYAALLTISLAVLAHSTENYFFRNYQALLRAHAGYEADAAAEAPTPAESGSYRSDPGLPAILALASCMPSGIRLERMGTAHLSAGQSSDASARFLDPELDRLFASSPSDDPGALLLRLEGRARGREELVSFLEALAKEQAFAGVRLEWTQRPVADQIGDPGRYMGFSVLVLVAGGQPAPEARS
jgi:type IV pilus assembly protein PilM